MGGLRKVLFTVALLASATLPAQALAGIPVGTHAGFRFYGTEASIDAAMDAQRAMGITALRDDVQWSTVESAQGTYVWTVPDRFIKQAAANGYTRIYLPLTKTPGWAASSDAAAPVTSNAALHNAYRAFVAAAVARYRQGGAFWQAGQPGAGLTAPEIYFEIWNEPWGSWAWKNADGSQRTPSGVEYAQMAKAVVQHVRGLHGAGGYEMLCHTQSFTNTVPGELFHVKVWDGAADLDDWCDGWSVHSYPEFEGANPTSDPDYYTPSGTTGAQRLDAVKYQFRRYLPMRQIDYERSGQALPIHLTEVGWPTSGSSNTVSEADQAAHYASVFSIARADRAFAGLVMYMARDQHPYNATLSREHYFGTRRSDGTAKPAHTTFANELATGIPDPLPYVAPKIQQLVDAFPGTTLDTVTKWPRSFGAAPKTVSGGALSLPAGTGIASAYGWDARGSSIQARLTAGAGSWLYFILWTNGGGQNTYYLEKPDTPAQWRFIERVNNVNHQIGTAPYVANEYVRLRHRPDTDSIVFETSPDKVNWTVRHTRVRATGIDLSSASAEVSSFISGSSTVREFNVP